MVRSGKKRASTLVPCEGGNERIASTEVLGTMQKNPNPSTTTTTTTYTLPLALCIPTAGATTPEKSPHINHIYP